MDPDPGAGPNQGPPQQATNGPQRPGPPQQIRMPTQPAPMRALGPRPPMQVSIPSPGNANLPNNQPNQVRISIISKQIQSLVKPSGFLISDSFNKSHRKKSLSN